MLRDARPGELDRLAQIWYHGWQDAHASLLPEELKRLRTLESFRDRLLQGLASTRVAEIDGDVVGFCTLRDDELYQLFVSAPARGKGVAAALVADAEMRLKEAGAAKAWLGCAIGNDRAARFYEKCGWTRAGSSVVAVETSEGPFDLEVWRYEKHLEVV
ncbi:GNAT family N-acetyltransferase [Lysobacter sp. Root494]|uniref:GNAT family N-acetyltransferase n=1 Tax=Lysobacter sp. Root494 TaxID=1736549 RepID=UPI0009E716FC|nr:GNAT family N-acetyltransferase [Lysobacter sp. Root494]